MDLIFYKNNLIFNSIFCELFKAPLWISVGGSPFLTFPLLIPLKLRKNIPAKDQNRCGGREANIGAVDDAGMFGFTKIST